MSTYELCKDDFDDIDEAFAKVMANDDLDRVKHYRIRDLRERFANAHAAYIEGGE